MAARRPITEDKVEQHSMGTLERSLAAEQEKLTKRNEFTPEAISEDLQHMRSAITTIWNNADLPMSVRVRWKAILSLISPIARDVEKLTRITAALTNGCYIIDKDGKFREATCEEIISALDNTPNK